MAEIAEEEPSAEVSGEWLPILVDRGHATQIDQVDSGHYGWGQVKTLTFSQDIKHRQEVSYLIVYNTKQEGLFAKTGAWAIGAAKIHWKTWYKEDHPTKSR